MYSKKVITERLTAAQSELDTSLPKHERFQLTPHSISKCRQAVEHLATLRTKEGLLTRAFTPKELEWIRNERVLCKSDFLYTATRYCYIKSDLLDGVEREVLIPPNIPQLMCVDGWAEHEELGVAIADAILKVRQVGISTLVELALMCRALFYPNINGLISSSDPDKTWQMAGMILYAIERLPYWLLPSDLKTFESGETLLEVPSTDSAITIQHGTQRSGIARGRTPTDAHLSEMGEYQHAEEIVDASLMRAMHESPRMFLVMEGTGKGVHSWWHRTYTYAQENYPKGMSRLRPRFFAWYLGDGVWPTKNWLKKFPPPSNWQPNETTQAHAKASAEYASQEPEYVKYLGKNWQMPKHQQWFYEFDRQEHQQKNILGKFLQEMPSRPEDAWQTDSGRPIFTVEEVQELFSRTKQPLVSYTVMGSNIPPKHVAPERLWDSSLRPIDITCDWLPGSKMKEYFRLQPVKWRGWSETGWEGLLHVWEPPQDGHEYGVGCDPSDGIGADRSVLEVLKKGALNRSGLQVAEYANSWLNATAIVPWQMAVLTWYSTRTRDGQRKQARLIPDVTKGDAHMVEARKRGWHNIHHWERYDRLKRKQSNTIGWYQVQWARDYLIDFTTTHLRQYWIMCNSPWLVEELRDLERNEVRQRIEAMEGAFDDRFFALGMAHISLHVWAHIFHNAPLALGGDHLQSHPSPSLASQNRALTTLPTPPMMQLNEDLLEDASKSLRARATLMDQLERESLAGEDYLESW